MKIHRTADTTPAFRNAVITVGTFDGVHRGHQKLIGKIREMAESTGGESVLVTFDPHPRVIIYPDESLKLLSTLDEKIKLISFYEVDHLVVWPFTKEFSLQSARDYVDGFLIKKFNPSVIVMGYNHQFGHHRDGNIELLRKLSYQYHFKVVEIEKQLVKEIEVSSTRIRLALSEGDITTSNQLLGHHYTLEGTVVQGEQLGKKLGFPTANISVTDPYKLIPSDGIYAVRTYIDGSESAQDGVLSIGMRPTVNGKHRTIEVFLFNFDQNIYDRKLKVEFIQWIREEKKFDSLELLMNEMKNDASKAESILKLN